MADFTQQDMNKLYENALIGFIIQEPQKMLSVSEILPRPDYFTVPDNRNAYEVFLKLFAEDRFPGSPALIVDALYTSEKKFFEDKNQAARYVSELLDIPAVHPDIYNPKAYIEYAEQIKWAKDKRDIQDMAKTAISEADRTAYDDREKFIGGIEDRLAEITMSIHGKEGLKHISEMTSGISEQLDLLHSGQRLASGIATGIDSLDRTLNGLKGGEVCVLAARPGTGKSLSCDTEILVMSSSKSTPAVKTMGDIKVGDYVFNRHGEPVEVLGVYPQGKLDAYKLTFNDGRTCICSYDHIWPYWQNTRRNGKPTEIINNITLGEMLERGIHIIKPSDTPNRKNRSRFAIPTNEGLEFPEADLELPPYAFGCLLGDGIIDSAYNTETNVGRIGLSSNDEEIVATVAQLINASDYQRIGKYTWNFYKEKYSEATYNCRLTTSGLSPEISKLVSGTLCGEKYIPKSYLFSSKAQRLSLLQGLMDTDGTIDKSNRRIPSFETTSQQLAQDVMFLVRSLGMNANITTQDRRGQLHESSNGKTYERKSIEYRVQIHCPHSMKAQLFRLGRKKELATEVQNDKARRNFNKVELKKVEKLPEQKEMVCIMVDDPEHLYLCNDFLVTHNTTLSMQIAYNVAMAPRDDHKKNAVLIFSLEMMEEQLISRMLATIGRINMQAMMEEYQHFVNDHYYEKTYGKAFEEKMRMKLEEQYARAQIALKHIRNLPIYPTTESGLSPNSIKSMVMQKKREIERKGEHLSLVVIDYLQLMVPAMNKANASRTEEVGDMSRKMKLLAKEFDVPVLLLAQLNRNADVTERPNLKDLRESGSIEQDADKCLFIWSENADKGPNDFPEFQDDNAKREALRKEQMKVIITVAKNRQGECGDCQVIFDKGFQTFVSQSNEYSNGENHESFAEFAEKYYQKTRNEDIFWPLRLGEIPEAYESHRYPKYRETDYLDSASGVVYTLSNDNRDKGGAQMGVRSVNRITNATQDVSAAQAKASELDRITPAPMPVIDDLGTDFGELDDEEIEMMEEVESEELPWDDDEAVAMDEPETTATSFMESEDDDDDEELDMDNLEMMDELDDILENL